MPFGARVEEKVSRFVPVSLFVLSVAAFGQGFTAWQQAGLEQARVRQVSASEIYPDGRPELKFGTSLTVVMLDKTNWTEARALRHLRRTASIFSACGIALDDVDLARGRGPGGKHDMEMSKLHPHGDMPADVVDFALRVPRSASWPRVFLVGRLLGDSALARAYQQGSVPDDEATQYPYMNTAWIAYQAHWEERAEKEYSSLAHELAHLLCRCGHSGGDERHLLHEKRNLLGARILEDDCLRMRTSPFVYPAGKSAESP